VLCWNCSPAVGLPSALPNIYHCTVICNIEAVCRFVAVCHKQQKLMQAYTRLTGLTRVYQFGF